MVQKNLEHQPSFGPFTGPQIKFGFTLSGLKSRLV